MANEAVEPSIPEELGGSWDVFVREWCCGGFLATSVSDVILALSTLKRLWPEEMARVVGDASRGLATAVPMVDMGLLLRDCESLQGFEEVLRRVKGGERSAYSELVLVGALKQLRYWPRFSAPIDGRLLDASCEIDGVHVFFEVVTPERSDASIRDQQEIGNLTAATRRAVSGCRVEIEVFGPLDSDAVNLIVTTVTSAPNGIWVLVASIARVRRVDGGLALPPVFDGDGAQVIFGEEQDTQGESTGMIIRWESTDARAKRVFNDEYHHFSEATANVLVVNVCAINDMKIWPAEMARLLQPTRNRNVGAVAFFEQGCLGPPEAIRRRWRVLLNPYAHRAVPERLLTGLEALDESKWYGLERLDRVVAA